MLAFTGASIADISAKVLFTQREAAECFLGKRVTKAVITVPAHFNDAQRQATKRAGTLAGLEVLRVMNEPTAAAVSYGLHQPASTRGKTALIFDLGGGTFDVTVCDIEQGNFHVKATAGDAHLGGVDFDNKIVDHLVEQFKIQHGVDLKTKHRSWRRLAVTCESAKRTLSSVQQVLSDAGMERADINDIVLTGGCSRIPMVQDALREYFDRQELNQTISPDEAVAIGAAVQGAVPTRSGGSLTDRILLVDMTALTYGLRIRGTCERANQWLRDNQAQRMAVTEAEYDEQRGQVVAMCSDI
eukprot:gene54675-58849_t